MPVLLSELLDPDREVAVSGDRRSLDRRLASIERHLRALDEDLSVLGSAVRLGEAPESESEGEPEPSGGPFDDVVWSCERCPARLGIYDPVDDILRLRHRDFIAHVRTGSLGFVRVVCRGCGHINEIHDEPTGSEVEAELDPQGSDDR